MEYGPSPNDCEMKLFSTTPKAEKDREMSKLIGFTARNAPEPHFPGTLPWTPPGELTALPQTP